MEYRFECRARLVGNDEQADLHVMLR